MKMIAIDLDGTLLNQDSLISPANAAAVREAQNQGILVTIATGRAFYDVQEICKQAGIVTPVIGANGATIHDEQGSPIHTEPMSRSKAMDVLAWLEEEQYYYEIMTDRAIYSPQNGHELMTIEMDRVLSSSPERSLQSLMHAAEKQYSQNGITRIPSYRHLPTDVEIYNILAFSFLEEKLAAGRSRYSQDSELTMVVSADHNFEVEHPLASKGHALSRLADMHHIPLTEVMAIGDSYNDISMMRIAGRSIAMGNAHQQIKDVCDMVTLTNQENGVAHAIRQLLGSSMNI
ncbi:Cof-type HAD-IIB family hydrolase [Paenibacillus sp. JX-17]|uniref:Cof-type HAD-IIB family hydrolase n=1 Tax=Paenibacillus lacisoli TaxID=3064525 RepID=A0ABT9CDD3_9BACL|nr:Cof-type HAD-IIB family hydrolase [Paenibacillus sp. JX-17]MDO7907275.1 Cof-type HAD-IIB family hydrolase [Paenibacillus sp. JX-17]